MLKPKCKRQALEAPEAFRAALAGWFNKNGMDYPWRRTKEPYAILVSEVMLQQTQIATVLGRGYYTRFLKTFPTVSELARSEDEPLLKAWEGLGYYRRARMLRETAKAVIANHGGKFPSDPDALLALPGVGRYTSGAIRAFAFDLPSAVVDGNVSRVLSRIMDYREAVDESAGIKRMWEWAEALADPDHPRVYNSAIMELGQKICRPGVPDCLSCPVAEFCKTTTPEKLPAKKPKVKVTEVDEYALWVRDAAGRLLMHREEGKRRQGLWKLPTRPAEEISHLPALFLHRYTITRYRVTLSVRDGSKDSGSLTAREGEVWMPMEEVLALAMPSPFRHVIEGLSGEM